MDLSVVGLGGVGGGKRKPGLKFSGAAIKRGFGSN